MILIFLAIGAIIGGLLLHEGGIVPGALLGYLLFREFESRKKVDSLNDQIASLKEYIRRMADGPEKTSAPPAEESALPVEPEAVDVIPKPAEEFPLFDDAEPIPHVDTLFEPVASEAAGPAPKPPASGEKASDLLESWYASVKEFVLGGNLLVRIGVGILFVGLSFLVKLAIENSLFPIELRLAAAGLLGVGMIAGGWRIAAHRPGYGVTLQGGGIAILFLTVFASFRLYQLIPSQPAFFILVSITILGSFIAIRQNAQSLAVLSFLGGFLAPIITSTGSGNHVALFSYYSVLNAGILYMSWNKPWRLVHMTGFLFTFGIAAIWGNDAYTPELFASTEPFLIVFFLMFVAIGLMYTIRHETTTHRYLDSSLVFGLPVVAFTLQAALVEGFEFGLAWSSLVMGAFYAALAWALYRRVPEKLRVMIESFSGIGLALISMTLPFALNATWTGTGWALEGAALIWLGIRQKRVLLRAGGLVLTAAAGVSFVYGLDNTLYETRMAYLFLANPAFTGFLVLSLASLFGAYQVEKNRERLRFSIEYYAGILLLIAGVAWWLIGGVVELERELTSRYTANAVISFVAISAAAIVLAGRRMSWPAFMRAALYLPFVLYLLFLISGISNDHLFANWGFLAWASALPILYCVLFLLENHMSRRLAGFMHAVSLWLVTLVLLAECYWLFDRWATGGSVWPVVGYFVVPLTALLVTVYLSNRPTWPCSVHRTAYLKAGAVVLLAGLWLGSLHASFDVSGAPDPLPYIPLFNPLDILLGFLALAGVYWYRTVARFDPAFVPAPVRTALTWTMVLTAFVWMNATIGRSVHHWMNVPYNDSLFEVSAFQTALSVCWTLLAVSVMAMAVRRNARTAWIAAAGLLALVVLKLFVVDLSSLTTLHRVISFIAVGLLMLLIGYVAPIPPKKAAGKI